MSEIWQLYFSFFRIGGLTFGGGLTMLPMLKYELVEKKKWISEDDLLDCYAIGQCTPGIIAVNTATYVGYKRKGIWGGIVATLGMVSPSLIIITILAMSLQNFMDNQYVVHALMGIRSVVCALMLGTVISLGKKSLVSIVTIIIFLIVLALAVFTTIPTIIIVVFSAIAGIVLKSVEACIKKTKQGGDKE